ncbi:MAG: 1-deoxy-D-xylulose-5-phosphate synthase [Spirochaetaceae bacterium]|nr:1-deoxy-D-xylulose-5-phosphate synthase [Spirochaetaceae bacterium]
MPRDGHIETPRILAELALSELTALCAELRQTIITTVAQNGGHLSSNLGVIELTVALHRVFSSPQDKIVWDVGHQCYAHKLLTGRNAAFDTLRQSGGIAGFPRRAESPHDAFDTGHASTSISVALGLLAGETLRGGTGLCVAVIGDGAMTGGLAYEALSNAGQLELPLIVILNDNTMSISPNVGGLSEHLSRLSMKGKYQSFRRRFDALIRRIPGIGNSLYQLINRLKRAVKAVFYQDNFFVDLGFEYVGPVDGHDLRQLIGIFTDVRRLRRNVVVHVITQKGRGYKPAEDDPGAFHSVPPFSLEEGKLPQSPETWTRAFGMAVLEAAQKNDMIVTVTAAMEKGTGLSHFRAAFPGRFFDVGIAEAHAVTFSAALAVQGLRPVVAIYSTFLQRAVDSLIHDTALGQLPVIFAIDRAGFVSADGETHQGLFDISLFRAVPNVTIMIPADGREVALMLDWALQHTGPCVIRYPKAALPAPEDRFVTPLELGKGVLLRNDGEKAAICIAFTGSLYREACAAREILAAAGHNCDLYHVRFIKPVDKEYLAELLNSYTVFACAEEGIRAGGFGEYLCAFAHKRNCSAKIVVLSAQDRFYLQATRDELLHEAELDGAGIAGNISKHL